MTAEPGEAAAWRPGLVALDIDGTLVAPFEEEDVTPGVTAAVQQVVETGAHVVLATGRSLHGTTAVARQLGITGGYLVCSNGAVVAAGDPPRVVHAVTFDAAPVVALLREHLPDALFAVEDVGLGYRVSAPFPVGELWGRVRVCPVDELVAEPVTRVILRSPQRESQDFFDLVERVGLHDVSYAVGYSAWLDLAPKGVTKATALELVRRRLGVDRGATLAVGDGRNDLEMLQWAGCGVAMGQAPAEVQDAADLVTDAYEDDGLVHALERLVLDRSLP